ncbi:aminoglycoside 6'-N-acetyltransferase I [Chitinophaga niastensis]|uniref:Aminoglycoside 6'-N-acetyltransferase I n=1 Tax=Chitinophaga niastensis TaxID=536980 RepID=A0A2P8HDJ5_CHINA|nr:GNAT family N-acetyltransferase [Chitinophaga niastensis]PSL44201.1 aminoglycoside 6'-N-acetyltransferase I [Chitinophaga niastensis]
MTIRKVAAGEDIPYDLLLLADPSRELINTYINVGEVYVMELENNIIAAYVLVRNDTTVEIKNIAVRVDYQGQGIGKLLLNDAVQRATAMGCKSICIGTGNSSIAQLYLYQRQGFEITGIRKDFFTTNYKDPIYENDILCKHMIMLERKLGEI